MAKALIFSGKGVLWGQMMTPLSINPEFAGQVDYNDQKQVECYAAMATSQQGEGCFLYGFDWET